MIDDPNESARARSAVEAFGERIDALRRGMVRARMSGFVM
jgi:hypothetical protein